MRYRIVEGQHNCLPNLTYGDIPDLPSDTFYLEGYFVCDVCGGVRRWSVHYNYGAPPRKRIFQPEGSDPEWAQNLYGDDALQIEVFGQPATWEKIDTTC